MHETKHDFLKIEFVEYIPDELHEGILYVSKKYSTAIHRCCCGCGNRTVTPISPNDWQIDFDNERISLNPSIGNFQFPCKSHYWIKNSNVIWV